MLNKALGHSINNEAKIVSGRQTSVTAADTITVPELKVVLGVVVSLETDAGDANLLVTAVPGLTTNTFVLKTWKTDGSDPTPAAQTSFGSIANWIAFGY